MLINYNMHFDSVDLMNLLIISKFKIMETIEERATKYANKEWTPEYHFIAEESYIAGAKEQKAIDDAELFKLKSAWEKETYINPYDEANYKQGYHDAIENACERLRERIEGGVHPQSVYSFIEDFRKAMEK